jgi:hypothetical protein
MQSIPIYYPRDLIIVRNAVRWEVVKLGIRQPMFQMRAAAAVTAMVELTLAAGATGWLSVKPLKTNERVTGVELSCDLSWQGNELAALVRVRQEVLAEMRDKLACVSDEVTCAGDLGSPRLTAHLSLPGTNDHE